MPRTGPRTLIQSSGSVPRRAAADSCGCAMGAKFLGVGLAASLAWYGWHWHTYDLSLWNVSWRVVLTSFAAAAVGKIIGILAFRMRTHTRR
jgi:hypothetical protein